MASPSFSFTAMLVAPLIVLIILSLPSSAFTFVHDDPAHCSNITFHWTGGTPPFRLLIISPWQPIRNISIPDSSFSDNQGTFTAKLLFAVHTRIMFAMSDSKGIASGKPTALLTVGDSQNLGCNTTSPAPDFFFSLNKDLLECKPYEFSRYDNATQPITVQYFIPNTAYFEITAPIGDTFSWRNNLTAGTEVIFSVVDAKGQSGGTSEDKVVIASDDKTCLADDGNVASRSAGPIAGGVIGGILFLFFAGALLWWLRRRQRSKALEREKFDLTDDNDTTHRHSNIHPTPYTIDPTSPATADTIYYGGDPTSRSTKGRSYPHSDGAYTAATTRKGYLTSPSSPRSPSDFSHDNRSSSGAGSCEGNSQVIMHTNITETHDMPLELPPQYAANRAPIQIPGLEAGDRREGHIGRPRKS